MDIEPIKRKLEELQLIQCSLLPGEHLTFIDDTQRWSNALELYCEDPFANLPIIHDTPIISIHVDGAKLRFELTLGADICGTSVSVRGEDIARNTQERWQSIVAEKMFEISDSEFPIYQLVSLHLLPLLHEESQVSEAQQTDTGSTRDMPTLPQCKPFHVLFTSHHLKAPSKRRSLQQWSSSLSLSGFAKVGYPGVIYAQGDRENIEEFVDNVKSMQWLALKVRFVEPLPVSASTGGNSLPESSWKEFQKVGEVVEEMRRLGREEYVVEMGIGSAGVHTT